MDRRVGTGSSRNDSLAVFQRRCINTAHDVVLCACHSCRHVRKSAAELPELALMFREFGWRGDGRKPGVTMPEPGGGAGSAMYKVSMCKFLAAGHCPYGDKCTFAHSDTERRQPQPGPSGYAPRQAPNLQTSLPHAAVSGTLAMSMCLSVHNRSQLP